MNLSSPESSGRTLHMRRKCLVPGERSELRGKCWCRLTLEQISSVHLQHVTEGAMTVTLHYD